VFFLSMFSYLLSAALRLWTHPDSELLQTLNLRTVLQNVRKKFLKTQFNPPFLWFFSPSVECINILSILLLWANFWEEIQAYLTWYQNRVKDCDMRIGSKDCDMRIGSKSTLDMRVDVEVGFKVVCNLLLVPYRFLDCLVYKYAHLLRNLNVIF